MSSVPPVAEFRDADQYRQPLLLNHGPEIVRPKPRRLLGSADAIGRPSAESCGAICRSTSREALPGGSSLKSSSRDLVGGSAPVLNKTSGRASPTVITPPPTVTPTATPKSTSKESIQQSSPACPVRRTPPRDKMSPVTSVASAAAPKPHAASHARSSPRLLIQQCRTSPASREGSERSLSAQPLWEEDEGVSADGCSSPCRGDSNTDCGSLSKSSSDGDPVVCRKRPPTRLKSRRKNILSFPHLMGVDETRFLLQRRPDCYGGSSSDENRSSGHASMSDGQSSYVSNCSSPSEGVPIQTLSRGVHDHHATFPRLQESDSSSSGIRSDGPCGRTSLKTVPEDPGVKVPVSRRSGPPGRRTHHRIEDGPLQLEGAAGLEDIRHAIEQLSVRTRTSYSTSTYSSVSGSESEPAAARRLIRHSSLETVNTNVTSADEFVWVDGHSRLVELRQPPWSNHDVLRVIQHGRPREHLARISMEAVPRLAYLLQRPLVRVAREAQRFARALGTCGKRDVAGALRAVLSPALADSCVKACHRAAAIFTVSGDRLRQSKSARSGLQLSVGRFHRWMCEVREGLFVHEYAAVYLTAAMENLLEEIVLHCLPESGALLTASALETAIAAGSDLWGLLQPFSHLNAGRTATGALALPRWLAQSENASRSTVSTTNHPGEDQSRSPSSKSVEQNLLTTCVGSISELGDLLSWVVQYYGRMLGSAANRQTVGWGSSALQTLYYFMRCSQLEHSDHNCVRAPVQELVYERPYLVLPPLCEWVRVASAHAEHRRSPVVDADDVMQAARLLLPGVDCPVRQFGSFEEKLYTRLQMDESECAQMLRVDLAFRMLSCGRTDLVSHAFQLLPPSTRANTLNEQGLTPLMLACMRGDEAMVQILLDAGADVNAETPAPSSQYSSANPETLHWTALTYATTNGHLSITKLLLEKGANVEGGAWLGEDKITETPLQLAAASGRLEMVNLLLSCGAHPFLSTTLRDSMSYGGASQRGCYSAIAVAAAHGQRTILHKLLSHPMGNSGTEVLSLEEILAEGASQLTSDRRPARLQVLPVSVDDLNHSVASNGSSSSNENGQVIKLTKAQLKALQEAMYQSAENGYLEITLDLRNIGVPWTLHCWMHTLATAHELQLENVIDQLLQDFLQVWPEDCSTQFVDECLPLLFTIFRHSKNEGTSLLLADIFSSCYGKEAIKEIHDVSFGGGARIDPKYVNNPEMSDVQFRVEGRVFYAHKIILVNASPRFKSMLSAKSGDGAPPVVQINDIRYDIFQFVMHYLYKGGCEDFDVDQNDVLELMAAANFFQLDGILRFCESRCSKFVDLDNVVGMYVHAKVYNAVQLLEYCQGFLLQNMVALLTYDDSVRKLIFGKKLHNHDVLSGLLLTLQARIKARTQGSKQLAGKG